MDLQTQLRAHRLWLDAAGGDLRIVEQAIFAATRKNAGRPPSYHEVLEQIQAIQPSLREDQLSGA